MAEMAWVRSHLLLIALVVLVGAAPAQAITAKFGDVEITTEPPPKGNSWHGYCEYVFHIHNQSAERPHTVSLSIPFEKRYLHDDAIRELRRTVRVGANEKVRLSLFQPHHPPIGGSDVEVTLDGRRQERELTLNVIASSGGYRRGYTSSSIEPLILLGPHVQPFPTVESAVPPGSAPMSGLGRPPSRSLSPPMTPSMARALAGMRAPSPSPRMTRLRAWPAPGVSAPTRPIELSLEGLVLPVVLPPLWDAPLGLVLLSAMVVAKEGWDQGEWDALFAKPGFPSRGFQFVHTETWSNHWLAYSRYDGIVVHAADLNTASAEVRTALWQYVETGGVLFVLGASDLHGLSAVRDSKDEHGGWTSVRAGFGICRISANTNYDSWDSGRFTTLAKDWSDTAAAVQRRDSSQAHEELPVIEDLGIPIRGLFVLMFLFTLAIGPLNLLVLTYQKRRIWLLWTTPLISLCTCIAVFGYMLLSEGWQGRLRSDTLTLLDETTHRATTIGWTGVYSPLTPSDGLHFAYETEVAPQRYQRDRTLAARSCTIDLTHDQQFESGWVEARVPALFKVRKSETRRERVTFQREPDGSWSIVNGLGDNCQYIPNACVCVK